MVEFNIGEDYWERDMFDCSLNRTGKRQLDELARRLQGEPPYTEEDQMWSINEGLERMGIESIASGAARVVVELKDSWLSGGTPEDCIAKVQWDRHYRQNFNEVQVWENANGRQASLLLPIIEHEESVANWILVPRAKTVFDMDPIERRNTVKEIRNKARDAGFKTKDIRGANVGILRGRGVIIDYGVMSIR